MSDNHLTVPAGAQNSQHKLAKPIVRQVTLEDITSSLKLGILDFVKTPVIGLTFGAFFVVGGVLVTLLSFWVDMSYISYPLACGFLLLGPFAALGLYEVSRRLQAGETPRMSGLFTLMWEQRRGEIAWMAFVVIFIQFLWMFKVHLLLALFLGMQGYGTFLQFAQTIFETSDGLLFLLAGHLVGAFFAMLLFAVSVVSFPMLLDTEVDFVTAMITSFKVVTGSPVIMVGWGLLITATLMASMIPMFVGLLVTLPVLGHTTWHLYKRVVSFEEK
ncbi:DUF2189 domain-containing protein [Pseudovibrio sp. POLY-S9]|uniref:DUF2189 domain-containing protein n=1 Tax=Pseudovibrio sp. POLY-S9 TaxID=1576596 RepID=UPI0007105677|nr:DUF2189 domain-containing protein [Pseudovibrio sp. POLY-S9]